MKTDIQSKSSWLAETFTRAGRSLSLEQNLMRPEFFDAFCRELTKDTNRLRVEQGATVSAAKRELDRVKREIPQLIEAIKVGASPPN